MNPNGPIENPDLRALLNAHRDEVFASFNCHQIGTVESFDADKQTASVKINARRVVYDKPQTENGVLQQQPRILDYPLLTDVPVFVASGGRARLTLPIAAGDTCLVLFNDRDLDAWWSSGVVAAPNSSRMHSLSDGLALVGFRSLANKFEDYSATDAELRFGDAVVSIKPDGSVLVAGGEAGSVAISAAGKVTISGKEDGQTVTLDTDGSIEALTPEGARLSLAADGTATLNTGDANLVANVDGTVEVVSANGARLDLGALASLTNDAGSLKTALDAVVTALTALNAKTGPSAAVQIAAAVVAIDAILE